MVRASSMLSTPEMVVEVRSGRVFLSRISAALS